jgi:hypothetical protein
MSPTITFDEAIAPDLQETIYQVASFALTRAAHLGVASKFPSIKVTSTCFFAEKPRNFAAVIAKRPVSLLYICPDLHEQKESRILGVLFHEMGHILKDCCKIDPCGKPCPLDSEQQTDLVVLAVLGMKLYYDDDMVQSTKPAQIWPRPKHLT